MAFLESSHLMFCGLKKNYPLIYLLKIAPTFLKRFFDEKGLLRENKQNANFVCSHSPVSNGFIDEKAIVSSANVSNYFAISYNNFHS